MRLGLLFVCSMLVTALIFAKVAQAEELAPGYNACADKAESTVDQVECLNKAITYWDKELNKNYKKATKECDNGDDPKACKERLLKAQRLWIQYKEQMPAVIGELHGGGSMSRVMELEFLATETKKQANWLKPEE